MARKQFSNYLLIILAVIVVACGSTETKKMKFFDKGKELYTNGEYAKAVINFRNAIKIDPNFAEAYSLLGLSLLKQIKVKPAFGALSKAVELNPELIDAQAALGNILLLGRKHKEAREKAEFVLSRNPEHQEALILKANCLFVDQKYAEAEKIFRSIVKNSPKRENIYLSIANIRIREGDLEGAQAIINTLLTQNENNIKGRLLLIRILEKKNLLPDAEREYKLLIKSAPDRDEPTYLLAQFYDRTGEKEKAENILMELIRTHPDKIRPRMFLVNFYRKHNHEEAMVGVLKKAINDIPTEYGPYATLAGYETSKKQTVKAIELLQKYIDRAQTGPDILKAKNYIAAILIGEKKSNEALSLTEEVLKENPKDIAGRALRGEILFSKNDFVGAIAEYRTVLNDQPDNIQISLKLARAHLANNENSIAKDIYKNILKKNKDIPEALLALGNMALEKKELDNAYKYFSQLTAVRPRSPLPYYKMGVVKQLEHKNQEASSLFEQALDANEDFAPALASSLNPLVEKQKIDEAIVKVDEFIKKRPQNSSYYILAGRLYAIKKDYASAQKYFEKAFEINPNSQEALFSLARLEQSQGSLDKALENYQKMRKLNPSNDRIALMAAMIFEQKNEPEKAKAIYEEILSRNPKSPIAANNLAFYYVEYDPTKDNLEKAEGLIRPLLENFKTSPSISDTAAWVAYKKGEYEKARILLSNIYEKVDRNSAINYHMGMIYLGLGDRTKAKSYLQISLRENRHFPGSQVAEKELAKLLQ